MVVIETERLILRPMGSGDLEDFLALYGEPEVARFTMAFDRPLAIERLAQIEAEWAQRGHGAMAIVERSSGRFLGRGGLKYWPQFDEVEVGWALRPRDWGHGYATETGRASIDWGFEALSVPYITAMINRDNARSLRVAQRLGLEPLREDVVLDTPVIVHAISRPAPSGQAA